MVRYNITEKEKVKVEVKSGNDKESVKEKENESIKSNIKNKENVPMRIESHRTSTRQRSSANIININRQKLKEVLEVPKVKSENKQQNIEYLF